MKNNRKNLFLLYLLFGFVFIGSWFPAMVIYSKITFDQSGTYFESFGILICSIIPILLTGNSIAAIISKIGVCKTAILGLLFNGLIALALIFMNSKIAILLLVAIESVAWSMVYPMRPISIKKLFPNELQNQVVAGISRLRAISVIISPPIAALAIKQWTLGIIMLVFSILCIAAIFIVISLCHQVDEYPSLTSSNGSRNNVFKEFIIHSKPLNIIAGGMFIVITFDLIYPLYIRDYSTGGLESFSALLMSFGLGAVFSSIVFRVREAKNSVLWGFLSVGLGLLLYKIITPIPVEALLIIAFITGFSSTSVFISTNTNLQKSPQFTANTAVAMNMATAVGQLVSIGLASVIFFFEPNYFFIGVITIIAVVIVIVPWTLSNFLQFFKR
ncbi:MFS transporter [Xenorhabdus beddingii]|nr:MFS transporter [Xenorhabdus beddingii]